MNKILELQKTDCEVQDSVNKEWSTLSWQGCQQGNGKN